jgi:hypothetical protein
MVFTDESHDGDLWDGSDRLANFVFSFGPGNVINDECLFGFILDLVQLCSYLGAVHARQTAFVTVVWLCLCLCDEMNT